jgi:hypothetical protein
LAASRKVELFNSDRILVRQIPSKPPYCIKAAFSNEIFLNDLNSMNVFNFRGYDPLFILGLINSKLISFWFINKYGKLQRGLFPQFKVKELKQFPIVKDPKESDINEVVSLVNDRIQLQVRLTKLGDKITDEKDQIERELKNNDAKIDNLIFNMYHLDNSEISHINKILI